MPFRHLTQSFSAAATTVGSTTHWRPGLVCGVSAPGWWEVRRRLRVGQGFVGSWCVDTAIVFNHHAFHMFSLPLCMTFFNQHAICKRATSDSSHATVVMSRQHCLLLSLRKGSSATYSRSLPIWLSRLRFTRLVNHGLPSSNSCSKRCRRIGVLTSQVIMSAVKRIVWPYLRPCVLISLLLHHSPWLGLDMLAYRYVSLSGLLAEIAQTMWTLVVRILGTPIHQTRLNLVVEWLPSVKTWAINFFITETIGTCQLLLSARIRSICRWLRLIARYTSRILRNCASVTNVRLSI